MGIICPSLLIETGNRVNKSAKICGSGPLPPPSFRFRRPYYVPPIQRKLFPVLEPVAVYVRMYSISIDDRDRDNFFGKGGSF